MVPKNTATSQRNQWRIVVNNRKLNEKTRGDSYPIPNITDLLDTRGRC